MDTLSHIKKLFDYNAWATDAVITSMEQAGVANDDTLKLLGHILEAQHIWHARIVGEDYSKINVWPRYSLDECKKLSSEINGMWKIFLSALSNERLDSTISYRTLQGVEFSSRLEDILTHAVNHSTYHRGQIASLIRASGNRPAVTDFIAFARK